MNNVYNIEHYEVKYIAYSYLINEYIIFKLYKNTKLGYINQNNTYLSMKIITTNNSIIKEDIPFWVFFNINDGIFKMEKYNDNLYIKNNIDMHLNRCYNFKNKFNEINNDKYVQKVNSYLYGVYYDIIQINNKNTKEEQEKMTNIISNNYARDETLFIKVIDNLIKISNNNIYKIKFTIR